MMEKEFKGLSVKEYTKKLFKDDKFFIVLGFFALASVDILNNIKANLPWVDLNSQEFSRNILQDHVPVTTIGFLTFTAGLILYLSLLFPEWKNLKKTIIDQAVFVIDRLFSINSVIVNLIIGYGLYVLVSMFWHDPLENAKLLFWVVFLGAEIFALPYIMYLGAHELKNNDNWCKSAGLFLLVTFIAVVFFVFEFYVKNS